MKESAQAGFSLGGWFALSTLRYGAPLLQRGIHSATGIS